MEWSFLQRIQTGLSEKRRNLKHWLNSAQPEEKSLRLGTRDEKVVQSHLDTIGATLGKVKEGDFGLCTVCHEYVDRGLLEVDYTASVCLDHLSEAERRQLENELELSQLVQRGMLPQGTPSIPGLDLAAFNRPSQIIGGDYFDFFRYNDGAHGFVIADAAGHGVSASLIMTSLQSVLRTLVSESNSPTHVLERINRFYLHNINFTTFVTVFLCHYDPEAHSLVYCNAGHNPPAYYKQENMRIAWLNPTGAAIGLVEDYHNSAASLSPSPGDTMLLYTDGVTEATGSRGEIFGKERLASLVMENAQLSSAELLQTIRQFLTDFTNGKPLADDVTLVACKFKD